MAPLTLRTVLLTASLAVLSLSCVSTSQSPRDEIETSRWLDPSPALARKIEDSAERLPWSHGMERVELIHWFASVGEPAYPTLLKLAADPRKDVAGSALAALGATRDSRLVESLHALKWPAGTKDEELVLERARTLLRLGDWRTCPELIHGLESERLWTRALSAEALRDATQETFGYDPRGEPAAREAAVQQWQQWWARRSQDELLPQPTTARAQG